jgi:Type IV secretory system Conjugative DNA transfer
LIGWDDNRHALTVAGSRAGKGVSLIVPNLILYKGSAFVIDPKGENAAITAGRRGKGTRKKGAGLGQDVYVLDPFDVSGKRGRRERPVSFNPWPSSISTARTLSRTPRCSPRRSSRILKRTATGRNRRKPCCAR